MTSKVDISTSTFIRLLLVLLGLGFLFIIRDVLVLLFIVLIIVSGLSPTVERWSRHLTRPIAVVVLFVLIFFGLTAIFSLLVPPLITEIQSFATNLPNYLQT